MRIVETEEYIEHGGCTYVRNSSGEWFADKINGRRLRVSNTWYTVAFDPETKRVNYEYPPKEEELEAEYQEKFANKEEGGES